MQFRDVCSSPLYCSASVVNVVNGAVFLASYAVSAFDLLEMSFLSARFLSSEQQKARVLLVQGILCAPAQQGLSGP